MNGPTVSVCIVTCNQRELIGTCLRSVLDQEAEADVRVLVGDDASEDGTSELVAAFAASQPGKVRHFRRNPRMGAFANMRDLITRAEGEFIARTDGDDYWLPGKLQRQLDYLRAHPGCAAVYTNAITVDGSGDHIGLFNDVGDSRFDLGALLRRGNYLNNSSVLFRAAGRQAWLEVEGPQIDYRAHLWHARHGWIGHIGEPLTAYRVNAQGSMVAGMNDKVRELYWEAIQSVPRELISDHDFALGLADFLRRVAFRAARTRDGALLRSWAKRVFEASPYGRMRTSLLTLASILRILCKEAAGLFRKGADRKRQRILYRR
ncbi:MAG TPA: glycosyltransferase [Rhodanobacteraceae bacterium]|nr:glycosyltransferase [Rhodanobacteraceae bacterium]